MRNIFSIIFIFTNIHCFSQNLQVPPRNLSDPNGDAFVSIIQNMNLTDRENTIFDAVLNGNVPDFLRTLQPVTDSIWNGTDYDHILYYVIPDYLAIGDNSNYYLCPMTPILGQRLADTLNCLLPTRKMVNRIWSTAPLHLNPQTIPPSPEMTTVEVMADHDSMVWNQRQTWLTTYPLGTLTGGDKKDVILSNYIYAYPPPDRVVIFGWHYTSGTPIQPMYAGHESTYADYSHGLRLVQNLVWVDGIPTTATSVLISSTLNGLLSDEGTIDPPRYPIGTTVSIPSKPLSFCISNESSTELKIKIKPDNNVLFYKVFTSIDGINFSAPIVETTSEFILSGLTGNIIYYIKLTATNGAGESPYSEVLAAVASDDNSRLLIVNGYDRPKVTNTFDFIRYHAPSVFNYGLGFNASTNEALLDTLDNLQNYEMVDFLLGEESTVNETFSSTEQTIFSNYLNNGGKLFVSGAEIGWDLHYLGNATDSIFYMNYLKSKYVYDTPNNQPGTFYDFKPVTSGIFNGIDSMQFDDGTSGIYDVVYPDVIEGVNGGENSMLYSNLTNNFSAVNYDGLFPNGTIPGKLVYLGFPFETITTSIDRDTVMSRILDYFTYVPSTVLVTNDLESSIVIYPNPTTGKIQVISNQYPVICIEIYNMMGEKIYSIDKSELNSTTIDLSDQTNSIYILLITDGNKVYKHKIIKQ